MALGTSFEAPAAALKRSYSDAVSEGLADSQIRQEIALLLAGKSRYLLLDRGRDRHRLHPGVELELGETGFALADLVFAEVQDDQHGLGREQLKAA